MQVDRHTWDPTEALSDEQTEQLEAYVRLLVDTNQHVNLISRADENDAHLHHVVHSLALSYRSFAAGSRVVDWGTGGGLPGLPLAIRFPEVSFEVIDATRKKILAVRRMIRQLGLSNVEARHGRAENWDGSADYAVSRATAPIRSLWQWYDRVRRPLTLDLGETDWTPGLLALKGGELSGEIRDLREENPSLEINLIPLQPILGNQFFHHKVIVSVRD